MTRFVAVAGGLRLGEYVVRCATCSARRGWFLLLIEEDGVRGERARLQCRHSGHVDQHPLVYPGMISALAEMGAPPPDWRPHDEVVRDLGDEISSDLPAVIEHHPWRRITADRRSRWPELVAALG